MRTVFIAGSRLRRRTATAVAATALAAVAVLASAVGFDTTGLMLRNDHRVAVITPPGRAAVSLPVTVRFSVGDVPASVTAYGVFLDRTPPRAGDAIPAGTDRTGIYLTTRTQITIDNVVRATSGPSSRRDDHEITVVFFDKTGRRVGESAASVEFEVKT